MKKVILLAINVGVLLFGSITVDAQGPRYEDLYVCDTEEQIDEEIREGEMEMLAQLIEAEAGNQDYYGKCLVADVVLNRVASDIFPNSVEEVIFQDIQFSSVLDGNFDEAGWTISEDSFSVSKQEYEALQRVDEDILYFTAGCYNPYCTPAYKYGGHYFGY